MALSVNLSGNHAGCVNGRGVCIEERKTRDLLATILVAAIAVPYIGSSSTARCR
jgi:hypothetical protein